MNKPFDLNDDLSDLLGGTVAPAPRALPQDPQLAQIRETVPEFTETCPKCGGSGAFRSWTGRSVGRCFTCQGKGKLSFKTSPQVRAQARQRAQEAKQEVRDAYRAEAAWIGETLSRGAEGSFAAMLRSFLERIQGGHELSARQLEVIHNGMARSAKRAEEAQARRQERAAGAPAVDVSKILEAIQRGKKSGLKWVSLRFQGITMEEAKRHPDVVYVKRADRERTYLGKIQDGRFLDSRFTTPEDRAAVLLVCADPLAAAKVYGNLTNSCCVCGRELTNKQSVEEGIGPICAGRMGWTPGGIRVQAGVDF